MKLTLEVVEEIIQFAKANDYEKVDFFCRTMCG